MQLVWPAKGGSMWLYPLEPYQATYPEHGGGRMAWSDRTLSSYLLINKNPNDDFMIASQKDKKRSEKSVEVETSRKQQHGRESNTMKLPIALHKNIQINK